MIHLKLFPLHFPSYYLEVEVEASRYIINIWQNYLFIKAIFKQVNIAECGAQANNSNTQEEHGPAWATQSKLA